MNRKILEDLNRWSEERGHKPTIALPAAPRAWRKGEEELSTDEATGARKARRILEALDDAEAASVIAILNDAARVDPGFHTGYRDEIEASKVDDAKHYQPAAKLENDLTDQGRKALEDIKAILGVPPAGS